MRTRFKLVKAPRSVEVGLDLKFFKISGTWEPNDAERLAAWELYVELITRVAVVPLGGHEGLLSEALDSVYSLFATTRDILRRHGPTIAEPKRDGQYSFGYLAVALLKIDCAPFTAIGTPSSTIGITAVPKGVPEPSTNSSGHRPPSYGPTSTPPASSWRLTRTCSPPPVASPSLGRYTKPATMRATR